MSESLDPRQIKQIGHEARKPLISLISTADLLLLGLEGELSDQVRKDVEAIRSNAEQALAGIERLTDLLKSVSRPNEMPL